ncbi:MAG: sugar nucleotide-binding protein [Phycisphaerae bacterium]
MNGVVKDERWVVTGASGQLGGHILRSLLSDSCVAAVLALVGSRPALPQAPHVSSINLADLDELRRIVCGWRPTHIVHAAAMTAVADAYADPPRARRLNVDATVAIAEAAAEARARLVFTSTDMVFDGQAAPYPETSAPTAQSVYGKSKIEAERRLAGLAGVLTVRVPLLYGTPVAARDTTFTRQLAALRAGEALTLFVDEFRTPIALTDAAAALIGLARSDLTGLIHIAGPRRLSRYDLIAAVARLQNLSTEKLKPTSRLSIPAPEPRPADLSLDGTRFLRLLPSLAPRDISREAF